MTDPSRLLETSRSGLERELLRSALGEVAPDSVRARVLSSVGEVLANAPGAARPPIRTLALRIVHAAYLSGLLAAAAGVGVVLLRKPPPESELAAPGASLGWLPGPARSSPERAEETPSAPPARGKRLASLSPAEARAARLAARGCPECGPLASTHPDHLRAASVARNAPARSRSDGDEPADWLGAQLQLLREAREQLEAGRLKQAERVLDSYEQRFPGGVVGPQVSGLRDELIERRVTARNVPARNEPARGVPIR